MSYPEELREQARALRRKGYSYKEILAEVPASKSTIRYWVQDIKLNAKARARHKKHSKAATIRVALAASAVMQENAQVRRAQWRQAGYERAQHDEQFRLIGALYWAEGTKGRNQFRIANSDPVFLRCVLAWLTQEKLLSKIKVAIQYRADDGLTNDEVLAWWRKEFPEISEEQYYRPTGVKKRTVYTSNRRTHGVATLNICSTELRQRIEGCIEALKAPFLAPVVK